MQNWRIPQNLFILLESVVLAIKNSFNIMEFTIIILNGRKKERGKKKESVSEWVNEWISEWMNEWMNEWMSEWMNEWMSQQIRPIFM